MPEGDTVFRAAARLHEGLAGREVIRFELRVPHLAEADLRGEQVLSVAARGKHLLMRIGDQTLHSHLKMEGRWDVLPAGGRWPRAAFRARAIIGTPHRDAVGFDLAMLDLVPTTEEHALVDHLGPDPLTPDWDGEEAALRVGADRRAIHVALLDQRNVAGFGNEYANELLFVRGVLPTTPATEVDTAGLIDTGARMLRAGVGQSARTFTGDSRPGQRTWVYRREKRPCRRCGTTILGGSLGAKPTEERIIFWCPRCQK